MDAARVASKQTFFRMLSGGSLAAEEPAGTPQMAWHFNMLERKHKRRREAETSWESV